jgi:predicted nucleic acid-binding protein
MAPARPKAVLDTSFWVMACRAEVAANCLDYFRIVPPRRVEEEIFTADPQLPTGEYPYATLFRHLRDKMVDPHDPEPPPIKALGPGEAAAIALALALGVPVLINEAKAKTFASRLGVGGVTVPAVIVALYSGRVISAQAAWRKLELISGNTAPEIIKEAASVLRALGA